MPKNIILLFLISLSLSCQSQTFITIDGEKVKIKKKDLLKPKIEKNQIMWINSSLMECEENLAIKIKTSQDSSNNFLVLFISSKIKRKIKINTSIKPEGSIMEPFDFYLRIKAGENIKVINIQNYESGIYVCRLEDLKNKEEKTITFEIK